MQHVFIIGSKGLGNYGGYETFVDKLTEYHQDNKSIKYHIACKANGSGYMDETQLEGVERIDEHRFLYHNADCFKVHIPEKIGAAQAIYYDIAALKQCVDYCRTHTEIKKPIVYILACRIGPFIRKYVAEIHRMGGVVYVNPDGHEWLRAKWSKPIRWYWKQSERGMVKYADRMVCDSINIENYIKREYKQFEPETTFIAYGADINASTLADDAPKYVRWMKDHGLQSAQYYLIVGRFVPENNFETMIREFMKSGSKKDLAIITTKDDDFLTKLDEKLHFTSDKRIKFVGTVYDQELLKKIRENAYGYLHGHSVGGTNPSLLEALGATNINLLLDVGFNKEVGCSAAMYWNKSDGNLAALINEVDQLSVEKIKVLGESSKKRIADAYSWQFIADQYAELFGES